jgi:hypothetical protein
VRECEGAKRNGALGRGQGGNPHSSVCLHTCMHALWHGRRAVGAVAGSAARLQGGWRAKTATTWLDRATALECSGGEVTGRQNSRDGVAASKQSAQRHMPEERREEANEWARPEFKISNKNQILLQIVPFQTLVSKLGKNPGKFMPTGFDVLDNFCYWRFLIFETEFELKSDNYTAAEIELDLFKILRGSVNS